MGFESKIGLGTVQFGLDYGISNTTGQTSPDEVSRILNRARLIGIEILDTASAYGNCEKILGGNNLTGFKIVSKFMPPKNGEGIALQLLNSISLFNIKTLYGYIAHRPLNLISDPSQWLELIELKNRDYIKKIGFSFNEPYEVDLVLQNNLIPDIIQVPYNYLDQRFYAHMYKLKALGCEIHTRSTFLQGLFFTQLDQLSKFFDPIKPTIKNLQTYGTKLPGLLLKYCLNEELIDKVIIGVNSESQLIENIVSVNLPDSLPKFNGDIPDEIRIPSKWRIQD